MKIKHKIKQEKLASAIAKSSGSSSPDKILAILKLSEAAGK